MRLLDFTTVTPRQVASGYLGRYLHSDNITQGRVDIAPGAVIADHAHPHERHSARAITACVVLDVFHPPRDDYR
jgi:hypothetical protein